MKLQLIRNATLLLDYAGHHILIDPDFGVKHSRRSFTGKSPNPMTDLPLPPERILAGVELVIVSHLHSDHFDAVAQEVIPKHLPLLCQPGDEIVIRSKGFTDVTPVRDEIDWQGIHLTRTGGHHGLGEVETMMGQVSGFVFQAAGELTLYWAGDTVLCDEVYAAVKQFQPDVIVTHSCGATWPDSADQRSLIVMDDQQTLELAMSAADSTLIAVHMEALDHATISRQMLRQTAQIANIDAVRLHIPDDGDMIEINL
jgi:L-ascorbate metabolism protein UlaG (beta-lactamase superfamily)